MSLPPCRNVNPNMSIRIKKIWSALNAGMRNPADVQDDSPTAKDANGTQLAAGDKITLVKDLKVKASSQASRLAPKAD